jgi:hypothetical protein
LARLKWWLVTGLFGLVIFLSQKFAEIDDPVKREEYLKDLRKPSRRKSAYNTFMITRPFIVQSLASTPEELGRELGLTQEHVKAVRSIMSRPLAVKTSSSGTYRGVSAAKRASARPTGVYRVAAAKKASSGRTKSSRTRATR